MYDSTYSGKRQLRVLFILLTIFFLSEVRSIAQDVYLHATNKAIYDFLDELAGEKLISLNSAVKPYSRAFIAQQLHHADTCRNLLTLRQQNELDFYLKDFNKELLSGRDFKKRPDLFYYTDSLFKLTVNPIAGIQYWYNKNGSNYHRWGGAEAFAYIGNHFGVYASLRDNHEDKIMGDTGYLNTRYGVSYKSGNDYSEMRGGFTYSWKWGTLALVKDHNEWGNTYHYPNIISAKAPSYAQIRLHLKPARWFEFNYFHGWLVSDVIDSAHSYTYNGIRRDVFHKKYLAANLFTFIPWQGLNLSAGNSIVYSDIGVHPAYLIPVFFYKSVDHTYNSIQNTAGQNSQLFLDISCRLIPKMHFYYSMYLDDLSFYRMFDPDRQSNHWSMKVGYRLSNLIPDVLLTAEYTRTNPLAYRNDNLTTLYQSNSYNLGHYLFDNADVIYLASDYKPLRGLHIRVWYEKLRKGPEYPYIRQTNPATGVSYVWGRKFLEETIWQQQTIGLLMEYQIINDVFVFADLQKKSSEGEQERFTAPYFMGDLVTFSGGVTIGF